MAFLALTCPAVTGAQPGPRPDAAATGRDHQKMMEQLGIRRLRPGPSARPGTPNSANYDEAKANVPEPPWRRIRSTR